MTETSINGSAGFAWRDDTLDDSELMDSGSVSVDPDAISLDPEYDVEAPGGGFTEPDATAIGGSPRRPRGAAAYERKLRSVMAKAIKVTATKPGTVPDSAALILYSPKVAQTWGEVAAKDPRIGRAIDMLFEGTENPYLNAFMAAAPLLAQIARNHEPVLEPRARGIKIPFLRRTIPIPFKLGIRIGPLRNVTDEPRSLANYVFSQPSVQDAFRRQEVPVAWREREHR